MKKKSWIIVLALVLMLGLGITAYAAAGGNGTVPQRLGFGRVTSMRGYDYLTSVLKGKLGLTDADINSAIASGKNLYELAEEKGMTADELKSALYEERAKAVDDAVSKGTITKEQGDIMKANMSLNMENCTGSFGQGMGRGLGKGRGNNGNGRMGVNCPYSTVK
jgi:hypothetical protein